MTGEDHPWRCEIVAWSIDLDNLPDNLLPYFENVTCQFAVFLHIIHIIKDYILIGNSVFGFGFQVCMLMPEKS